MSNKTIISIRKALSRDLAFRITTDRFFDTIEALDAKEIVVDFSGVTSISRSFAHQYIIRQRASSKKISEINVPMFVEKMFEIVRQPKTETVFEISQVRPLMV